MRRMFPVFLILLFTGIANGQKLLTFGAGYSTVFFTSESLDRLKNSYNKINSPNMSRYFTGLDSGDGVRFEFGCRFLRRWDGGVTIGYQYYNSFDGAAFNNGQGRNLELGWHQLAVDCEYGRGWNKYFVNGLLASTFFRHLKLQSEYIGPDDGADRPISGNYSASLNYAIDAGVAMGLYKEPFLLVGKITYPLLRSKGQALRKKGGGDYATFPADFVPYVNGQAYPPLKNDIDGVKITLSFSVAWSIW